MSASPKILAVDDNLEHASHLEQALHVAGYAIAVIFIGRVVTLRKSCNWRGDAPSDANQFQMPAE